ncbi:MAG: hypothetical protein JXB34_10880 [Bacteroidales bacterium]|nr:hypothetical protein [Bacteroidales bacterium]
MKQKLSIFLPVLGIATFALLLAQINSCTAPRVPVQYPFDTLYSNTDKNGHALALEFKRGKEHNHPLMAIWVTDTSGNYIETLFIAESIGKGYFDRADKSTGKWLEGFIRRPAALPVWAHSRNVQEADGLYIPTPETAMPDAITGATPPNNFVLFAKTSDKSLTVFDVYFEINQTWDWNEYWTNNKFPGDEEYKTSCQPALIYKARIDAENTNRVYKLEIYGRGHHNGSTGEIFYDLETLSTAKQIAESIHLKVIGR